MCTQLLENGLTIARIIGCETCERQSHDVVVMQLFHAYLAARIKPKAMYQHHVFGFEIGIMWTNAVALYFGAGHNHLENELMFGRRSCFPSLAHTERLLFRGHFCGQPRYYPRRTQRVCRLHDRRKNIARRHYHQSDVFAVAFGDADALREESLLVIAEDLLT